MKNQFVSTILSAILLILVFKLSAQVAINIDGSPPDNSAILDTKSNTKGFLPPRMSYAQRNGIPNPADGLIVFCSDCGLNGLGSLSLFMTGAWYNLSTTCQSPLPPNIGTHIPYETLIIWTWNTVPGAIGYKWNTTDNYATAQDMSSSTMKIETGLYCNTSYIRYIWAYNICGNSTETSITSTTTACGTFTCGLPITDIRDGASYNTILIGVQCWFAQNLNLGTKINGSVNQTNNNIIEKYCQGNNEAYCTSLGGMYQWDEMMQYVNTEGAQGICPAGWHVPTDAEWSTVTALLGGVTVSGGKMKETGTQYWNTPNFGATNSSGFTARGGGNEYAGNFVNLKNYAYFWTSSPGGFTTSFYWRLNYDSESVIRTSNDKSHGLSVRCLRN